jgi:alpha-glucosidase (family GH31 glycosyl hydrolase)
MRPTELTYVPDSKKKEFEEAHPYHLTKGQRFLMGGQLTSIPVLVKGGSFVPMSPIIQSTESYADSNVTIHYYDAQELSDSKGMWYEDDGLTNEAYEKGMFKLLHMNMSQNAKKTKLTFQPTYGSNMSQHTFTYNVMIHSSRIPKSISVNGKKMKVEVMDQKIKLPMALKEKVQNIQINW